MLSKSMAVLLAFACTLTPQAVAPGFGLHNQQFVVRLLSPISTQTAKEGDSFTAAVEQPTTYQSGTIVGRITKLKRPQRGVGKGKNAEVQFQFEQLAFGGRRESVTADIKDVQNSQGVRRVDEEGRVIGVSSNKKRVIAALVTTGIGAAAGGAAGGARGAGIGAGSGLAAGMIIGLTMTTSGSDIDFKPGSIFTLNISDARAH